MVVREYLSQLKENKKGKPTQIRDAIDIYLDLWARAIEQGTVSDDDEIGEALSKLDKAGGLYGAAGEKVSE